MLVLLEDTLGSHESEALDNLLDVTISVLLHSTSSSADPATKSRELRAVWLVTRYNALLLELLLKVLASDSRLDTGYHVVLVNPEDPVHSAHVKRNNHSLSLDWVVLLHVESLGYVCAATVWDQDDVQPISKFDNRFDVLSGSRIDH